MALTRRERNVGMVAAVVLIILGFDRFLLTPYLDRRDNLISEQINLLIEYKKTRELISRWKEVSHLWEEGDMTEDNTSLYPNNESTLIKVIRDWAEESGMVLSLLKPEGTSKHGQLEEKTFQFSGTGSMKSISMFLWQVGNSQFPLKIKDLQLAVRREGTDEFSLQVRIGEFFLSGRNIPQLEERDETFFPLTRYGILSERLISLKDRMSKKVQIIEREPIIREIPIVKKITLTGVVHRGSGYTAFFEDMKSKEVLRVSMGERVMDGIIEKITLDYVELNEDGIIKRIKIGDNLEKILSASGGEESVVPVRPKAVEILQSDETVSVEENKILERLMERRRREIE